LEVAVEDRTAEGIRDGVGRVGDGRTQGEEVRR
jgi:hypothetical protein